MFSDRKGAPAERAGSAQRQRGKGVERKGTLMPNRKGDGGIELQNLDDMKSKNMRRKSVFVPKQARGEGALSPKAGVSLNENTNLVDGMSPNRLYTIDDRIPRDLQDYQLERNEKLDPFDF